MADLEKVIKALEWILKDDRFGFGKGLTKPETDEEQAGCYIHDAIELLKEQHERIEAFKQVDDALTDRIIDMQDEQPEIVRCKDCKWMEPMEVLVKQRCRIYRFAVGDDFYCADGKRK